MDAAGWLVSACVCVDLRDINLGRIYSAKIRRPDTAKYRLIVDPMLYGVEFALTAVSIRYVFLR